MTKHGKRAAGMVLVTSRIRQSPVSSWSDECGTTGSSLRQKAPTHRRQQNRKNNSLSVPAAWFGPPGSQSLQTIRGDASPTLSSQTGTHQVATRSAITAQYHLADIDYRRNESVPIGMWLREENPPNAISIGLGPDGADLGRHIERSSARLNRPPC